MAAIQITIGETARLALVLEDGDAAQYPRAKVYSPSVPTPLATLDLIYLTDGMYETQWLPGVIGTFNVVYTVFTDASYTLVSDKYGRSLDQVRVIANTAQQTQDLIQQVRDIVVSIKDDTTAILAIQNENYYIDNTIYDDCCQVLSSRMRVFDSKAHCELATDGGSEILGLVATYQIVVDYEGPAKMKTYRKVKL